MAVGALSTLGQAGGLVALGLLPMCFCPLVEAAPMLGV